jgi:hypothetical protein
MAENIFFRLMSTLIFNAIFYLTEANRCHLLQSALFPKNPYILLCSH